VKISPLFM